MCELREKSSQPACRDFRLICVKILGKKPQQVFLEDSGDDEIGHRDSCLRLSDVAS
ncbi:hypothetical protein K435DRAFT_880015 [Dendrothele bispora CBS 962.96]|uniref:Uncharacterized protein n=1 Tax=Dendrothele bispora (strain CBS 962.96) TaxID=1314807 RepID=A0A4S8KKA4_DENBC|nr:hypothetical protein K435DRAFT_880015 [Dendrothele bispora CBS 962.96]